MLGGNLKAPQKKTPPPGLLVAKAKPPSEPPADPVGDAPPPKPMPGKPPMDEAEPPAEAANEDYGAKLITDMKQPLMDAGMDEATATSTLSGIFKAMAACLEGDGGVGVMDGLEGLEGDAEEMPAA